MSDAEGPTGASGEPAPGRPPAGPAPEGPDPSSFSSGESGHVAGLRRTVSRRGADLALDALDRARGTGRALDRLAAAGPRRSVLALSVYRPGGDLVAGAARELERSRHAVRFAFGSTGAADPVLGDHTVATDLDDGKFPNLNRILEGLEDGAVEAADWVLVIDDDVILPPRFLDRFVALCEAFALDLAQPAQTLRSHAAWRVTRRRPGTVLRRTRFVEIGPVTAFAARSARELIPFPELRYGWGLELHWAARAERGGWRLGVVDATPVRHERSPVASAYGHAEAIAEARAFLAERPFLESARAHDVLATHRRVPSPGSAP